MAKHPKKTGSQTVRSPRWIPRKSVEKSRMGALSKRYALNQALQAECELESQKIADSLLIENIIIRQDRQISVVDAVLEKARTVQSYRRVQFLPCVQGPATKHFRDALAAYLQANHGNSAKMVVIKIRYNWTLQFANTENVISLDDMNVPQTDMHSHLYFTGARLKDDNYGEFLSFTRKFMQRRGCMHYCYVKTIESEDIDKSVRYAFYINKRGSLADVLSSPQLAEFFQDCLRLRFFRPSGGFRLFLRILEPKKEIVAPSGLIMQQKRVGRRVVATFDEKKRAPR